MLDAFGSDGINFHEITDVYLAYLWKNPVITEVNVVTWDSRTKEILIKLIIKS